MEEWFHAASCTGGCSILHKILEMVHECDGNVSIRGAQEPPVFICPLVIRLVVIRRNYHDI